MARTAALLCLALLLTRPAAASRFRGRGRPLNTPISVLVTVGAQEARVSGLRFSGTPTLGGRPIPVDLHGAQLGLGRPTLVDTALHIDGDFHHVALGATFGLLLCGRTQGPAAMVANRSGSLTGYYVGPELGTVWTVKNFDVRAGVALGYRSYEFPLTGFDPIRCGKNGASVCEPSISASGFFLKPTLTMGGHYRAFSFGVYGGGDVMPGGGWSAGGYLGIENQLWHDKAAITRPN